MARRVTSKTAKAESVETKVAKVDIEDDFDEEEAKVIVGEFFTGGNTDVDFISSGCTLLDLVLGGGLAGGRVINIVGDKSSGKTLLCIEACANFVQKFAHTKNRIWYNEAEAAFDEAYAEALGLPLQSVTFTGGSREPKEVQVENASNTVEGLADHISKVLAYHRKNSIDKGLYIIDSIDALSDDAEMKREIGDSSYGASKAKKIGEMFRRVVREMKGVDMTFIMVSQIRDNIGVTFGETKSRSGGRALDFYSSQIIWLAEVGKQKKTIKEIERVIGVNVRVRCKKNKVGLPFREADYYLQFAYGIDDLQSNVDFLFKIKEEGWLESELQITKNTMKRRLVAINKLADDDYYVICDKVSAHVKKKWYEIERGFTPVRSKYARNTDSRK